MNQYRPGIDIRPPNPGQSQQAVETTLFEVQVKLFKAGVERADNAAPPRQTPPPVKPPEELKPKP
jgi:hypothetical protein